MATQGLLGTNAGFEYTPSGGSLTTHQLAVPLRNLIPIKLTTRFARDSVDYTERDVYTVGAGVWELEATIRYENDPQGLLDMLVEGYNGTTLTYYPDLSNTSVSYDFQVIGAQDTTSVRQKPGDVTIFPDHDRWPLGEYMAVVRFRLLSAGDLSGIL